MVIFFVFLMMNYFGARFVLSELDLWSNDWRAIRQQHQQYTKSIMDTTVKPCDDFKRYSCGNWTFIVSVPEHRTQYNVLDLIEDEVYKTLNETFSENTFFQNYTREDIIKQTKDYYDSCMNVELIKKSDVKPMLKLIDSMGGCPALNPQWNVSSDWIPLIAELRLLGSGYLIDSLIDADFSNSSNSILYIDQPSLECKDKDDYTINGYLADYKRKLKNIIQLLGGSLTVAKNVSTEILNFEKKLANISKNNNKRNHRAKLYKRTTVGELHNLYPLIDWNSYLSRVLKRTVDKNQEIFVENDYLTKLMDILADPNTTSGLIFNFAIIRYALSNRNMFLTTKDKNLKNWWKTCLDHVITKMDMAIGHIFVRKFLKQQKQNDVKNIINKVKDKFKEVIQNADWMDNETIEKAVHKLESIDVSVGLPEFMKKRSGRKKLFKNIRINVDDFFENSIELMRANNAIELSHFFHIESSLGLAKANGYYDLGRNKITLAAGLLQLPFYHPVFPQYQKYGIIGAIIGHELGHAFDNIGRNYDSSGIAQTWWTNQSLEEYNKRIECFIKQYDYLSVSGRYSLSENIADNVGIKIAFLAYKDWLSENQNSSKIKFERIEGLDLSSEQLFFVSFVQWRCEQNLINIFTMDPNDPHPPEMIRVNGTLSNSEHFSEHFTCEHDAQSNPNKKCKLW